MSGGKTEGVEMVKRVEDRVKSQETDGTGRREGKEGEKRRSIGKQEKMKLWNLGKVWKGREGAAQETEWDKEGNDRRVRKPARKLGKGKLARLGNAGERRMGRSPRQAEPSQHPATSSPDISPLAPRGWHGL